MATPSASSPSVIAPGNYDGVHLGHQALLRTARAHAQAHGLRTQALTFDPHPLALLAPERPPARLTTIERRRELLLRAGADAVIVQPFTREFAALEPEAFVQALLQHQARALVVGPDFRFGRDREGDVALLERYGARNGLSVIVEPPVMVGGMRVSSSAVREAIAQGDVQRASVLLGHVHEIEGEVVRGDQRGRTLGFPTANVRADVVLPPADGVYAVVARVVSGARAADGLLRGVANLGQRPTFAAGRSLEVHLFDYDSDLYGVRLRVGFVTRVRPERKFGGIDQLRAQIALDCESARATLVSADEATWAWI
jgi:riboflavin kinase / FMN adenylyltransferase